METDDVSMRIRGVPLIVVSAPPPPTHAESYLCDPLSPFRDGSSVESSTLVIFHLNFKTTEPEVRPWQSVYSLISVERVHRIVS